MKFKLLPETFQLEISLMDRFLSLYQVSRVILPSQNDLVYISAEAYSREQILKFEQAMLNGLGFALNSPLPIDFLRRFSVAAQFSYANHFRAKYLIDISLQDHRVLTLLPSQLAADAVYLVKVVVAEKDSGEITALWSNDMMYYTHYSE